MLEFMRVSEAKIQLSKPQKIGYFTDLHFRQNVPGTSACPERASRKMANILNQCIKRLKKNVDLIICTGDLVDDPDHPEVKKDLWILGDLLESIHIPTIIIPGNHDIAPDIFYHIFRKPNKVMQIEGCEFITFFDDICKEGKEASVRTDLSLKTMQDILNKNPSKIKHTFLIQHYLIYPEYNKGYPYSYQNASVIRGIMEKSPRKIFSISGHYHHGFSTIQHNGVNYFCGSAMCENPFPYYILDTNADKITIQRYDIGSCSDGSIIDTARGS